MRWLAAVLALLVLLVLGVHLWSRDDDLGDDALGT